MPKKLAKPVTWKNTFFWLAGILFIVGIIGLFAGDPVIRDPGQKREGGYTWMYFAASILMVINGLLSHRYTVMHYEENREE